MIAVRALLGAALVTAATGAPAQTQVPATAATFPEARVACQPISLPLAPTTASADQLQANAELVAAQLEAGRLKWLNAARRANFRRMGGIFLEMPLPPRDSAAAAIDGQLCAVVPSSATSIAEMTVATRAAQPGFAGYCTEIDPEKCLGGVFSQLGFTADRPWPRLPIYSLWRPEVPLPQSAADVITFLSLTSLNLEEPPPEEGTTYTRDIDNLGSVCGQPGACAERVGPIDTTLGKGIAWFIRLNSEERPMSDDNTGGGSGE